MGIVHSLYRGTSPDSDDRKDVLMLGCGGHAESLLATLRANGIEARGCISPYAPSSRWQKPIPWLGDDGDLCRFDPSRVILLNGIGSVGDSARRRDVFERATAQRFSFLTISHPSAIVEADVVLGEGAQVMAGAILQTGVAVGTNSIVNTGAIVDHSCAIGAHAHLAPGVRLSGDVIVENGAHIGTGAVVIQGVTIGARALVAAGAVVIADVAAGQKVGGAPARVLR